MDKINLAELAKTELTRNRGFAQMAEEFLRLGSIEQAEGEARDKLRKVRTELDGLEAELAKRKADVEKARGEAENIRAAARKEAETMRNDARLEVDGWREKAREDALRMISEAQRDAGQVTSKAAKDASASLVAAENARSQREVLQKQIDQAIAELSQLEGKISRAKETIQKMMGA